MNEPFEKIRLIFMHATGLDNVTRAACAIAGLVTSVTMASVVWQQPFPVAAAGWVAAGAILLGIGWALRPGHAAPVAARFLAAARILFVSSAASLLATIAIAASARHELTARLAWSILVAVLAVAAGWLVIRRLEHQTSVRA